MNRGVNRTEPMASVAAFRHDIPGQRGIALIVGLVILAILSMIGVAAFTISTQEERMAGNSRDRMRAFEAAESALRLCENYVAANGAAAFTSGAAGMYTAPPDSTTAPKAETVNWSDATQIHTDAALTAVNPEWSAPPACIAESFQVQRGAIVLGQPVPMTTIAHIVARGYGLNQSTVVRLESYYAM
jgi:type IV pilus assembly protein PilX